MPEQVMPVDRVCVEHLTVYYEPQYGDQPFCVDEELPDNEDGTRNPGGEGMRFATPEETGKYVAAWLKTFVAKQG